jgi:hypothetical protein
MADLSFHGELLRRHFRPLPLNEEVLAKHRQLDSPLGALCIPMAVEFVLKLEAKIRPEDFRLQNAWTESQGANFSEFDGKTIEGLKFKRQFSDSRGDGFPLDPLFSTIEQELASRRYVIISLAVEGDNWHNYVIYNRLPDGEFEAVTKGREPKNISNVKEQVRNMQGTDILTYERIGASAER